MLKQIMTNGKIQYEEESTKRVFDSKGDYQAELERRVGELLEKNEELKLGEVQSESREMAIPEEETEVVAGVLESPLVVIDGTGNEIELNRARFIRYYLPSGATEEEIFHCYQQTRATGLNPMIPGECHYFKTGDRPMRLFTGYQVYTRKAYASGLIHIHKPDITFDENGKPEECTITLQIKDRPDFVWTTWFDEVKSVTRDGKLNARWNKAGIFQFIKCSVVNTLRWSGLVEFSLPYIVEEMDEPVVEGYRSITQEQLDAHESAGITVGEVSASHHQKDLSKERKHYFVRLKEAGIEFADDEERRSFQEDHTGKPSTEDWGVEDYLTMGDVIAEIRLANKLYGKERKEAEKTREVTEEIPTTKDGTPVDEAVSNAIAEGIQETEERKANTSTALELFLNEAELRFKTRAHLDRWIASTVSDKPIGEWAVSECAIATEALMKLDELPESGRIVWNAPGDDTEEASPDGTHTEEEEGQEQGEEAGETAKESQERIKDQAMESWRGTPIRDPQIRKIRKLSLEIEDFQPHGIMSTAWHVFFEEVFGGPVRPMKSLLYEDGVKLIEALENRLSGGDDTEAPDEPLLVTTDTYRAIKDVLIDFPEHRYLTIKSRAFKERAGGIIGYKFTSLKNILDTDAKEILRVLKGECLEAVKAHEQGQSLLADGAE